jgi:MFS family permease
MRLPYFFEPLRGRPQITVMLVNMALVMCGNGIISPVLSVYASSLAASTTMIGIVISAFGFGRLLMDIPAGMLFQRMGARALLVIGPALIAFGAFGAALSHGYVWLVGWRLVQGLGSGIYMTAAGAALVTMAREGERGRLLSLYQASQFLGLSLGPAVGGFIAQHFGFNGPFWVYGIATAAAAVLGFTMVGFRASSEARAAAEGAHGHRAAAKLLLGNFLFVLLCVVNFGMFFTRTASYGQLIPLLGYEGFGMGMDDLGVALTFAALMNVVVLPIVGWAIDRFGARGLTIGSTLATGAGLCVIALGATPVSFWLGLGFVGFMMGLNVPANASYLAEILPKSLYGPAVGLSRFFGDLGLVLGPVLVGIVADLGSAGYVGGLLFNAAILMVAAVLFGFGGRRRPAATPAAGDGAA